MEPPNLNCRRRVGPSLGHAPAPAPGGGAPRVVPSSPKISATARRRLRIRGLLASGSVACVLVTFCQSRLLMSILRSTPAPGGGMGGIDATGRSLSDGPRPMIHPRLVRCSSAGCYAADEDGLTTGVDFGGGDRYSISRTNTTSIPERGEPVSHDEVENARLPDILRRIQNVEGGCVPMQEWQVTSYPSCNSVHELDLGTPGMDHVVHINDGGSRTAWRMSAGGDSGGVEREEPGVDRVVLKNLRYKTDFGDRHIERQRKDGVVTERLSASKYVIDMYGFCGTSLVTEFADGGNIHDYIKSTRRGGDSLSNVDKLRVGVQIATAVADMHGIDDDDRGPTFSHMDVCCHQFLLVDGVFKLNDFNNGLLLKVDKRTNGQCRERSQMKLIKMRSPEEMRKKKPVRADAVDVYLMANVMYYVLTNQWLFENLSRARGIKAIAKGKRSPFPRDIERSKEPPLVAMKNAILACWADTPDLRPSAREVSDYLLSELQKIDDAFDETSVVRAYVPEREKNQRPTDTDFYRYNG